MSAYDFLKDFSTSIIAICVAFISLNQWRTSHNRFVLDLYEERMKLYRKIEEKLDKVSTSVPMDVVQVARLADLRIESNFIFGDDIVKALTELVDEALKISNHENKTARLSASEIESTFNNLLRWRIKLNPLFMRYMRFSHKVI